MTGVATTLFAALTPTPVGGAYYMDCAVANEKKNPLCGDMELQRRLWAFSEEVVERVLFNNNKQQTPRK